MSKVGSSLDSDRIFSRKIELYRIFQMAHESTDRRTDRQTHHGKGSLLSTIALGVFSMKIAPNIFKKSGKFTKLSSLLIMGHNILDYCLLTLRWCRPIRVGEMCFYSGPKTPLNSLHLKLAERGLCFLRYIF